MKNPLKSFAAGLLALALAAPAVQAQPRPAFSQPELDQMLAPIALYPDPLLSQILMAATYPLEVVQAARWTRANRHLSGEDAARAVDPMDWDPSVKSLVAFPQVLDRMDERLEWTERLGEAFLAQEAQVMDTIQDLRHRAALAGNLDPNEHMRIVRQADTILIEPARPPVVYVPYYDPAVAYGTWLWPAHPPVYWAPWPGYVARVAYAPAYLWGSGTVIRIGVFFGSFDWPRRVTVVNRYYAPRVVVHEHTTVIRRDASPPPPERWRHDARHRRGAPYRFTDAREVARHAERLERGDDRRDDRRGQLRDDQRDARSLERREEPRAARRTEPGADRQAGRREDRRDDRQDARRDDRRGQRRDASPVTQAPPVRLADTRDDAPSGRGRGPAMVRVEDREASTGNAGRRGSAPRAEAAAPRESGNASRQPNRSDRGAAERRESQARRPAPQPNATAPGPNGRGAVTEPAAAARVETRAAAAPRAPAAQRRAELRRQGDAD